MCCVMPPASPADHVRVADRVEQRGLAVVDVTHHGHDRRARRERLGGRLARLREELLLLEAGVLHVEAELGRHLRGGGHVDRGVDRDHRAERHQLALDVGRLRSELARELADRDRALDAQHAALLGRRPRRGGAVQRVAPLAPRRGRGARIDRHLAPHRRASDRLARERLLLAQVDHFAHELALAPGAIGPRRALRRVGREAQSRAGPRAPGSSASAAIGRGAGVAAPRPRRPAARARSPVSSGAGSGSRRSDRRRRRGDLLERPARARGSRRPSCGGGSPRQPPALLHAPLGDCDGGLTGDSRCAVPGAALGNGRVAPRLKGDSNCYSYKSTA